MSDFSDRLGTLIEAKTPIIQIVSYETLRVYSEVKKLLKMRLFGSPFLTNTSNQTNIPL